MADFETIAVAQAIGRLHPVLRAVDKCAVGGDVMQPIGAIAKAHLAMAPRNGAARVGQRPVEMLVATNVDASGARDPDAERAAVGQPRLVLNGQDEGHASQLRSPPAALEQDRKESIPLRPSRMILSAKSTSPDHA
jgi:hypothetical protein